MLGLDALEVSLFERLCDEGRLPNLAAFRTGAKRFTVRSDGDLLHGSVWPTFASGTNPGAHGVYFWTQWLAEEQRHVRNNHPALAFDPFWSGFAAAGRRATVVDVPYVALVPGRGMRGAIGWGLHDEVVATSEPADFRRAIEQRFGRNPLSFDTVEPQGPGEKLSMAKRLRLGVKRRSDMLTGLAAGQDWDLMVTVFSELHMAGHYLAAPQQLTPRTSNVSAMAAILRPLDDALPAITAAAGPDCDIFLFALHGMREQVDYAHFAPQILDALAGRTPIDPEAHPDLLRRVRNAIPDSFHRAIWKRLPARLRAARQGKLSTAGLDTTTAPIFPTVHDNAAAFRLNIAGRERDGVITAEEGEALLAQLEVLVASLVAEDGQPAFGAELVRPASRWHGSRLSRLPDAFATLNSRVTATTLLRNETIELHGSRPEARNGAHTAEGFCYVRPGGPFEPARETIDVRDFAPSILRLLQVPEPSGLEGESFIR
jgi:predicted AlkP superfamily phosphohydrolase/phosphomutase